MGLTNIKQNNREVVFWETRDGKRLNIDEMPIEHLRNIVKIFANKRSVYGWTEQDELDAIGYGYMDQYWKD